MEHSIVKYLSPNLKMIFSKLSSETLNQLTEIRLRINKPLIIYKRKQEIFLTGTGRVTTLGGAYIVTREDIIKTIEYISNFSLYAFENELKNGFITISGGHRVGFCGSTVVEAGMIKTLKNFSGLNIRINHQILNVSQDVIDQIRVSEKEVYHTMIIAPPAAGKTTLLRDIIRNISTDGKYTGLTVGVVDERSEIAGAYLGISQNELGPRTDVMDNCPKSMGMKMLLRSMAPAVIAVDELGKQEDIDAIEDIVNGGVKLICTVHGKNIEEIKSRDDKRLKIFDRYIVLGDKLGEIQAIYNKAFERIG